MANTLSLRRRIKTAQNISKTTRALQMIAASRLKKAQNAATSSRPYVDELMKLAQNLAPESKQTEDLHPYMIQKNQTGKTLYIIVSPDRGLCGSLITNLVREYLKYKSEKSLFVTVGKKLEATVSSTSKNLIASFPAGNTLPSFDMVSPIQEIIEDYFLAGKVDEVKLITTLFVSVFAQRPKITNLLPVSREALTETKSSVSSTRVFEPTKEELLPALLQRYLGMTIYQHLLESYASFQAAQMIAMQNATNNAKDIVSALQLLYNKARQEKITKEILDISSAALAMEEK